ncbi:glycosyltransferase family 4 protein [Candidatus Micrarchaeota archaeon]|nr:glycosyltransferase family 4 protein [Candidatus Micrarchaeota archaeon]MBU2475914.1 glycosyltransferase family 4 protein [Candidatus Micrarchaeota archaeon]
MKILITSMFYKKSYGQGLCAEKLAEFLARKRHKVTVFHGEKNSFKGKKNLKIERIKSSRIKGLDFFSFALNLKQRLIKEKEFDVFYPQDYTFGLVDFSRLNFPVIYHARGTVKGNAENRPKTRIKTELMRKIAIPLMAEMDKKCCEKAKTIIAASKTIKKEIKNYYKIPDKKIRIVSDGVDLKKFSKNTETKRKAEKLKKKLRLQNKKIILFAGRLVPQKGIIYLVKAMPKVIKEIPQAFLLIAGENTQENHKKVIEEEIAVQGIQKHVKFQGYVEQKKMPEVIQLSDLIASPSTYEPIGIINIEAIALGKPIVYSKNIGSVEVLKNSGIAVNPRKPQKISAAITKILSSKKLYKKFSNTGRKNAAKVEWNKIGSQIEKILMKSKEN